MSHSMRTGTAVLLALAWSGSAMAAYDDWMVLTPAATGMMGEYVYDVLYDDSTGKTWIAADDPIWDGGTQNTQWTAAIDAIFAF